MKKQVAITALLLNLMFGVQAQTFESVRDLAQRRVPWLATHLVLKAIDAEKGHDVFELKTEKNNLQISASNANAAAYGLNWYLRNYCHRSMSHMGDNLGALPKLPSIKNEVRVVCPHQIRYALNYCTISYTMSFYTWTDWERELDWMALNGVNLMLTPVGTEAIWQNMLLQLGYTQKETFDFIAGPAFSAWWLMGNLEGWGGPVSQTMIDQQAKLQVQILKRMKEFAIEPVLNGFCGLIPTTLKTRMKLNVVEQGEWAGGFQRPDFLNPADSSFAPIAQCYYDQIKKLYGSDIKYFGGDLFHEGGNSNGIDVTTCATQVQHTMQAAFPGSTWVLQGWGGNPLSALLNGLDKDKTLVIELFGENTNNWERRKGYENTPFIWCHVSNFGEKLGIYGRLQRFADEIDRAKNSNYASVLKGVGIIPEGIHNNPVAYDLIFDLAWKSEHTDVNQWIRNYIQYRYGKTSKKMEAAWQMLLETAYSSPVETQEGPSESIFCARPGINIKSVSSWGTRKRLYDIQKFEEAVRDYLSVSKDFKNNETYEVDKIDFVRQVLANKGDVTYNAMMAAIKQKDKQALLASGAAFCQLILKQDSLLSSNKHFTLNTWLQQAVDFGTTEVDKSLALKNAKIQISYWGPDYHPKTNLHEYAHKEWNGILSSLYLARWNKFIADEAAKMDGRPVTSKSYFEMELEWTLDKNLYVPKKLSEVQLKKIINEIMTR